MENEIKGDWVDSLCNKITPSEAKEFLSRTFEAYLLETDKTGPDSNHKTLVMSYFALLEFFTKIEKNQLQKKTPPD